MSLGLARYILSQLEASLPMLQVGGGFQGGDGVLWAISEQRDEQGTTTGKIVMVCDDVEALEAFKRLAHENGHIVIDAGPQNTVIITPNTIN